MDRTSHGSGASELACRFNPSIQWPGINNPGPTTLCDSHPLVVGGLFRSFVVSQTPVVLAPNCVTQGRSNLRVEENIYRFSVRMISSIHCRGLNFLPQHEKTISKVEQSHATTTAWPESFDLAHCLHWGRHGSFSVNPELCLFTRTYCSYSRARSSAPDGSTEDRQAATRRKSAKFRSNKSAAIMMRQKQTLIRISLIHLH